MSGALSALDTWGEQTVVSSRGVDARGYSALGLHMPKTKENVGAVLRAALCFGVKMVAVNSTRLENARTNTMATQRHVPVIRCDDLLAVRPWHSILVAVELADGAEWLHEFKHPASAFYVFGPEDGSVPKHIRDRAQHTVKIRSWRCLNLAASVNVVLADRAAKRGLG